MTNNINKTSHVDIAQNPDVVDFLKSCTYMREPSEDEILQITRKFIKVSISDSEKLPDNIITIDSSSYESQVRDNIPFTNIGYVKLVNSLLKNNDLLSLKGSRFVNPFRVAEFTDEKEAITFVLPSSNIKFKDAETTKESFRLALDEYFENIREEKTDRNTSLKSTLFWLSSLRENGKPNKIMLHECPNGCGRKELDVYNIEEEQYCPECHKRIFATDTLRLYEEVDDCSPTNKGVLGRFEKAIRHIQLAHLLRILKLKNKDSYLKMFNGLAIVVNGPLAIAGTAAWLYGSLMKVIYEINVQLRKKNYSDLLIIGLLNGGLAINDYASLINQYLEPNSLLCVSDEFREKYIDYNRKASNTTFGNETYYGQDFIWKNKQGNIVIFDLPYIVGNKHPLEVFKKDKSDYSKYNNLQRALSLLQELKCDLDTSSIVPLVLSRQYTAISMEPGAKVLDMLSKNNLI
ncbi:MAG: DNA double-strand break repair nuclease NurA [Clostridia bacterium]|nr:DNA double-strand break repair nuclease NurA [Clostridia bacterium]